jgi:thiamine biosynthesis protein ThiI
VAETLLLRYGELALKSPPVRREFEARLKKNVLLAFLKAGMECIVTADHGHLYVQTADAGAAIPIIRRIFGLVSVSEVTVMPTDLDAISAQVVTLARGLKDGSRFAVRSRRTGTHPFTSHDVDVKIGADILGALPEKGLKVDLTSPETEFHVEIRGPKTYLYSGAYSAPGGFPLGVAGRVGAHVNGMRGALGAWLMMKRGCRVYPVASGEGRPLMQVLGRYDPEMPLDREAEEEKAWELLRELVAFRNLSGLSLPLSVEDYPKALAFWGETVIFSPTVGMEEGEVKARWQEIANLAQ